MIDRQRLLKDLQAELPKIEQAILAYLETQPARAAELRDEHRQALEAGRTAAHFVDWQAERVTQAAVAWLLACVFIRFLEDNRLLDEPLLAGPGERLKQAKDRIQVHFADHPAHAERDYLLDLFASLEHLPALAELFDRRHNPLWQLPVSADGARRLIDLFQRIAPESGVLVHDFTDPAWDTRFLGDLYQDLSEAARKRYALLQTPEFVEAFILDHTLTPALDAFRLAEVRLIDPTCGSGHFLLTAFERLFGAWIKREPATNARALAQRALDQVAGVDLNPYAVAITRFRLLIAAMRAAGSDRLRNAPDFHFQLAVGDSLLHGPRHEWQGQGSQSDLLDDPFRHLYEVEDRDRLERILGRRYPVVVGNPPYITVKDRAQNQAIRDRYPTCHRKYSLGVPFTERFFDLASPADGPRPAGYIGLITANSFMKREFGKKLIEDYLVRKDLTHMLDTSGAYIPGHGTPTVILFARNRRPRADTLRAVLGIRGEPSTPDDAAQGKVWRSIVELLDRPGNENEFVSVVDQPRDLYACHPWSVGGGGAGDLKQLIETGAQPLITRIELIGFGAILGEDEAFGRPTEKLGATRLPEPRRPLIEGELVRDWTLETATTVLFPYDDLIQLNPTDQVCTYLWPLRTLLWQRNTFGNQTYRDAGRHYAEYHQIPVERNRTPLSITFAFVATHNHFVLDRGGKVFKQSAPVIKLPAGASEADHLALLGLLNSSTACFWMKQVFHNKGNGGIGGGIGDENWEPRYEHDGTKLKAFPIPDPADLTATRLASELDSLAQRLVDLAPNACLDAVVGRASARQDLVAAADVGLKPDLQAELAAAEHAAEGLFGQMVARQEALDWHNYRLYGLIDADLGGDAEPPSIRPGERPFEIALARRMAAGETQTSWFARHGSTPTTAIPDHWPAAYRELTERRLAALAEQRWIRLIEQPEYKRRWNREPWDKRLARAARNWLLDRIETLCPLDALVTAAQLADRTRADTAFQEVAALHAGSDTFDLQGLVVALVETEAVPQMAAARYKPSALAKFRAWQETWDKQRAEDAIDARTRLAETDPDYLTPAQATARKAAEIDPIPLPPKYASGDFRKPSYWPLRGKLDVPKERFFSLPGCEKSGDATPVIGWAGLDHLQRAKAIAAWYLERKEQEGWSPERLMPMLVALDELIPWLKQWHNEIDPEFGERLGDYYEGFLLEELRQLELARDELADWQPPAATRGRRRRAG